MKTKLLFVLILTFMILAQVGCAPSTASSAACPTAAADTRLLTNTQDGYCLLYPVQDSAELPGFIVINPFTGPGDIPGDAWVNIQVQDSANRTAAQAADEAIAAAGQGFDINRSEIQVDGSQAIVVDGLPGLDLNRVVYIVRNNRLYTLNFMPWQPGGMQGTSLEHLYETILQSIHFPAAE